jgi:hypothetical protein
VRQIMVVAALVISLIVGAVRFLGRGEVVTITTVAPNGVARETPLWIVEVGDELYLRAGSPNAQWLVHIDHEPLIWLEMGGVRQRVRAEPLRDELTSQRAVNRAMVAKYGVADRVVGLFFDPAQSVPIVVRPTRR